MGFYNIYKILKDMLRTLFGKRFLKITIIVILIFTIFFVYNECFALSTILPITVDGVTFNFASEWNDDDSAFTGDMNNFTILRYEMTGNEYLYVFVRSSFPVHVKTRKSGNYTITETFSYNSQGKNTYYMYRRWSYSRNTHSISVVQPNLRSW